MQKGKSKPGSIHLRIVEVMRRFPMGITSGQIRQELEKDGLRPEEQTHLDRRKRDLKKWFVIKRIRASRVIEGKAHNIFLYTIHGERTEVSDEGQVGSKIRAEILNRARGRCQICGRTIEKHEITLVVDHRTPRDWGSTNDVENLWAICEECNSGKKDFFSSLDIDTALMKQLQSIKSVHVRIGELLKVVGIGNRTSSELLEVVTNQDDWKKRLRELRYPVIGWKIEKHLYTSSSGKKKADYILKSYEPWPADPSGAIRRFEEMRLKINRKNRG